MSIKMQNWMQLDDCIIIYRFLDFLGSSYAVTSYSNFKRHSSLLQMSRSTGVKVSDRRKSRFVDLITDVIC